MITKFGKQKLEEKILELEEELRRTYEERNLAAAEGDLKENSAYIFMCERAQVLTTQIEEAKSELKNSVVMTVPTQTKNISFGHKVTVRFENDKRVMIITIVGKNDAHLKPDWISCESPLGMALLNTSKLDKVMVNNQLVTILNIEIGEI